MNTTYAALLDQLKNYDPTRYQATRNYTNGAVTAWSPYISRGFLSPVVVMEALKTKYSKQAWLGLMQQMAWREYFQRVWQQKGDLILADLKSTQSNVVLRNLPKPINEASTGILAIDKAIGQLYEKGYLHNHLRMYLAMLHSNIFKAAWLPGATWMYAHLLDHDPAANFLSWQWVAGTFSSKQYVANQENINRYTNTKQLGTFLDTEYENLPDAIFDTAGQLKPMHLAAWQHPLDEVFKMDMVKILQKLQEENKIEPFNKSKLDHSLPFCIYNSFNLDPLWHEDDKVNRILILEPKHYVQFPISEKVMQFIVDLAQKNIPDLQIFIGSYDALLVAIQPNSNVEQEVVANREPILYFKEHPTTAHYHGIKEERDWLFPEVTGYYPSFFGYWKKCERFLK